MSHRHVSPQKENTLRALFGKTAQVVIGVVHARAMPGSPGYRGEPLQEIYDAAAQDAERYAAGRMDGVILENHGDIPFLKPEDIGPETVAMLSVMASLVRTRLRVPVGINVLANGAIQSLAIARAASARFIRVNEWVNAYVANEGLIEGPAARATRYRTWLHGEDIRVFADVHVKHGAHAIVSDRSRAELARDAEFFDADVLIVTGSRTADPPTADELTEIREATPLPVLIGSGVTAENVGDLLRYADGVIVGSSLKQDGVWWNSVDPGRVAALMDRLRAFGAR